MPDVRADSAIKVEGVVNAAGKTMSLETGRMAPMANGAAVVQIGDTTLLTTVVTDKPREGIDFFPLTVDVEERMYAAGKIPGSFFRREGRPGEQAVLTCRLTDRPLRPSFPEGFRNEVQVISTILGADLENPHDIASINGASAALTVSGIPFQGPIGAVRLAHHNGEWLAHPTYQEGDDSTFELVVAGRRTDSGDIAIMMVEAGGTEKTCELYEQGAPKITEEIITGGLEESKRWISAAIDLQLELRKAYEAARGPIEAISYEVRTDYDDDVYAAVDDIARADVDEAMKIADKTAREERTHELDAQLVEKLCGTADAPGQFADRAGQVKKALRSLQKDVVRRRIVNEGVRIDGRGSADIRPLSAEVGVISTAHGSGLFQRGETQVLSVATLAMPRMEQMLDTIGIDERKRYMHHYNFPPFSTGEVGRVGSPKRREIGHGALAERALVPVLPTAEQWPYTMRIVSDGLSADVLAQALHQAKQARLEVLAVLRDAIPEPRSDVRERAPKIVSFEIPLDKIGEVIGPKGKVINAITLETGADISVNDDGVVGTVTIGSQDGSHVEEARRRIDLILDPPMAEIGAVYPGKVVNITKFGAFVNILPGRDGLLHISKLGGDRRIDRVEDVLNLGDEVEVRVSDIDNQGKLSLSLVSDGDDTSGPPRSDGSSDAGTRGSDRESGSRGRGERGRDQDRAPEKARTRGSGRARESVSFEQHWETQAKDEFGDLGPADAGRPERRGGGGGRRRGGRGGNR